MKRKYIYTIIVVCLVTVVSFLFQNGLPKKYSEPEKTTLSFYNWYLKDIYLKKFVESPQSKLNTKGVYELDSTENFAFLKSTNYFSDTFFSNNLKMYSSCNQELAKVDTEKVKTCSCSPAEFISDNSCTFMKYMVWTGGQGEMIDSASIIESKVNGDKVEVVVSLKIKGTIYSYAVVGLSKEGDKWLIDSINTSFTKPVL